MISGPALRRTGMGPVDPRAEVVLLRNGAEVARWPLLAEGAADLGTVDQLMRLQLEARRQGCTLWLRQACPDLLALLQFVGLAGVLQMSGEAEGLEQGGVEEVVVSDDPVA
jgi:hypothetical protein